MKFSSVIGMSLIKGISVEGISIDMGLVVVELNAFVEGVVVVAVIVAVGRFSFLLKMASSSSII